MFRFADVHERAIRRNIKHRITPPSMAKFWSTGTGVPVIVRVSRSNGTACRIPSAA